MFYRLFFCFFFICAISQAQNIIPRPNSYRPENGFFKVAESISISGAEKDFAKLIPVFSASVQKLSSVRITETSKNGTIRLILNTKITGKEAYRLKINPKQITVEAGFQDGCFYGLQSLTQLIHGAKNGQIACCDIVDQPRFEWRGVMLDESRHFFGMEEVKKILGPDGASQA